MSSRLLSKNIQNYNFACGFILVWNFDSDIKGETYTEGFLEHGVEENIWTKERWSDGKLEKTA
jgi:hypothetical protein